MNEYLNENKLLTKKQFGFLNNHFTEYTANSFVDYISKQMEN